MSRRYRLGKKRSAEITNWKRDGSSKGNGGSNIRCILSWHDESDLAFLVCIKLKKSSFLAGRGGWCAQLIYHTSDTFRVAKSLFCLTDKVIIITRLHS
jgi:hypothetical protein